MTNEDLAALIQKGERDRLPELWAQVEKFVRQQAYRMSRVTSGRLEAEDLYQSGFLALVAAVDIYDAERGMSFVGLLAMTLKSAFAEAGGYKTDRQAKDPIHHAISLDAPVSDDDNGATLGDLQPDPDAEQAFNEAETAIFNKQLHDALDKALRSLPEEQETVLRARYYRGRTFREIGPDARELEGRALRKLRQPKISRELRQFVEERTAYYSGTGYQSFQNAGSQPERLVLERERLLQRAPH